MQIVQKAELVMTVKMVMSKMIIYIRYKMFYLFLCNVI